MKTMSEGHPGLAKIVYGMFRRFPQTRFLRRKLWDYQQHRFETQYKDVQVDEKIVLFEVFQGRSYADSPKAIYLQMLQDERFSDFVFVWALRSQAASWSELEHMPNTVCVPSGSDDYFHALAMAKYIVVNSRIPEYVYPKDNQVVIQCWHGTPLKRLGHDIAIQSPGALNSSSELDWRYKLDSAKWTYLLSASPYASEHLTSAFSLPEEKSAQVVLEIGDPGNDILVQARNNFEMKKAAQKTLGIPEGKQVLLYAPTWRDDRYESGASDTLDYLLDFDTLRNALGANWIVLFRPHYNIANEFDFEAVKDFVIDASAFDDINDYFIASDVLVTDYSSVMFDYPNTGNPILLFTPDLEHYAKDIRDFYFDIHEVPGPLCQTTEELCAEISRIADYESRFGEEYQAFHQRFCPIDDGYASQRVVDKIASHVA